MGRKLGLFGGSDPFGGEELGRSPSNTMWPGPKPRLYHSLKIDFSAHSFSEPFTENSFYAQKVPIFAFFGKMTPYGKIFQILFRQNLSRHPSTCCVETS